MNNSSQYTPFEQDMCATNLTNCLHSKCGRTLSSLEAKEACSGRHIPEVSKIFMLQIIFVIGIICAQYGNMANGHFNGLSRKSGFHQFHHLSPNCYADRHAIHKTFPLPGPLFFWPRKLRVYQLELIN